MKQFFLFFLILIGLQASAQTSEESKIIRDVHQLANEYRQSRGLRPLRLLETISTVAQDHAADMASGRSGFSHNGFEKRVKKVKDHYGLSAYSAAENLFFTTYEGNIGRQAVQGWIKSPGHHKNLKGQYTHTGIGVARNARGGYYVVQLYFKKG